MTFTIEGDDLRVWPSVTCHVKDIEKSLTMGEGSLKLWKNSRRHVLTAPEVTSWYKLVRIVPILFSKLPHTQRIAVITHSFYLHLQILGSDQARN